MIGDLTAAAVGAMLSLVLSEWLGGEAVAALGILLIAFLTVRHRAAIFRVTPAAVAPPDAPAADPSPTQGS